VKRVYTYILLMLATIVGVSVQATPNVSLLNMGSLQLSSPSQVNFYNPPTRPHAAYKGDSWYNTGWGFGVTFGATSFAGDVMFNENNEDARLGDTRWTVGLSVDKVILTPIELRLQAGYGRLAGSKIYDTQMNYNGLVFNASIIEYGINAKFNLLKALIDEDIATSPYLVAGVGGCFYNAKCTNGYSGKQTESKENCLIFPLGIGLNCNLDEHWDINLEGRWNLTNSDNIDALEANCLNSKIQDTYVTATLGVSYKIPTLNYNGKNHHGKMHNNGDWIKQGWGAGVFGGATSFCGDIMWNDMNTTTRMSDTKYLVGLSIDKALYEYVDFRLRLSYGTLQGKKDYKLSDESWQDKMFNASMINATLNARYDVVRAILDDKKFPVSVYATGGVGTCTFKSTLKKATTDAVLKEKSYTCLMAPVGLGVNVHLTNNLLLEAEGIWSITSYDVLDAEVSNDNDKTLQDTYIATTLGLTYLFDAGKSSGMKSGNKGSMYTARSKYTKANFLQKKHKKKKGYTPRR